MTNTKTTTTTKPSSIIKEDDNSNEKGGVGVGRGCNSRNGSSNSSSNTSGGGSSDGGGDGVVIQWSEIDQARFFGIGTIMYSCLTFGLHPATVLKTRQQVLSSSNGSPSSSSSSSSSSRSSSGSGSGSGSTNNNSIKGIVGKQQQQPQQLPPRPSPRPASSSSLLLQHQPTIQSTFQDIYQSSLGIRGFFRGAGIVLALAIPARIVYIGVLENCRHDVGNFLRDYAVAFSQSSSLPYLSRSTTTTTTKTNSSSSSWKKQEKEDNEEDRRTSSTTTTTSTNMNDNNDFLLPIIATIAGGIAGGLAAVSAQILVVPMDVISQRQMVMPTHQYIQEGSTSKVIRSIMKMDGIQGLYSGFGLSIFTSLPAGSIWWATYSGSQVWIQPKLNALLLPLSGVTSDTNTTNNTNNSNDYDHDYYHYYPKKVLTQIFAGCTAAIAAATITQPLDVVKTRVQVTNHSSYSTIIMDLFSTSGIRGFYRGLGPRIGYITLWGTCLSSGYELLRHFSRKSSTEIIPS